MDTEIYFFAYGTLRRGERLHGWLADEIIEDKGEAKLRYGKLFFAKSHRAYPYLVFTGSPSDNAVGEVYKLPLNEQVYQMLEMEVNAGYALSEVEVELEDGTTLMCVACTWKERDLLGDEVADNDWTAVRNKVWL
jgi:gamma-glutamylcyclotransferase (GGCT)/AIG2-like uncharacterized protein YtfP